MPVRPGSGHVEQMGLERRVISWIVCFPAPRCGDLYLLYWCGTGEVESLNSLVRKWPGNANRIFPWKENTFERKEWFLVLYESDIYFHFCLPTLSFNIASRYELLFGRRLAFKSLIISANYSLNPVYSFLPLPFLIRQRCIPLWYQDTSLHLLMKCIKS